MNTWTTDKPLKAGDYWLSLAPAHRSGKCRKVIRCSVYVSDFSSKLRVCLNYGDYKDLDDPCLSGAQWRPVEETPSDPFAEPPPRNSRDDDLP